MALVAARLTPYRLALALTLLLLGTLPQLAAAGAAHQPTRQTAPCYRAALAALTQQGALYSQGGALSGDPIDPATGAPYPRTGPHSFDCSGLVWWAYAQAGVVVGETTHSQINDGAPLPCTLADLHGSATTCWTLGDLLFLRYNDGQHVALYVGAGLFMDCYNHAVGCLLHDVTTDPFYAAHFSEARRIVSGCEGLTHDPGQPSSLPPSGGTFPDIEALPALLAPVFLVLPWQCGACGNASATSLIPLPESDPSRFEWYDLGSWFNWLVVQLWNHAVLPILCWLLALTQVLLNALETVVNALIAGINAFWRLALLLILWLRGLVFVGWAALVWFRDTLWALYAVIVGGAAGALASLVTLLGQALALAGALLGLLVGLVLAIVQALLYLLALLLTLIPALLGALTNPTTPPQVSAIADFFLLAWLRELFQALADSRLGWAWLAFIALVYARFLLWLLDETSTLNA